MTTSIWTGGGNNRAGNGNDWSGGKAPLPGDTLWMGGGTMNIGGSSLAGNALRVEASYIPGFTAPGLPASPPSFPIINLRQGADVHIDAYLMTEVTINVSQTCTLDLFESSYKPLTLGTQTLTVNLAPHAVLNGAFTLQGAGATNLTVNGAPGAAFRNGESELLAQGNAKINADVLGVGSFDLQFHNQLEFGGSVGAGQTVNHRGGVLIIDAPGDFHGTVNLMAPGDIDLRGLMEATSYDYGHDSLSIYSGDQVIGIFHLRIIDPSLVISVGQSASGLDVSGHFADGSGFATPLPLHPPT